MTVASVVTGCRQFLDSPAISAADACTAAGCLLYSEGNYIEAHGKFAEAAAICSLRPQLTYAMGLCCYQVISAALLVQLTD